MTRRGIVNLFVLVQYQGKGETASPLASLRRPKLESVAHLLSIRGRGKPMPVRAKVLRDRAIGGKESLGLARGLEPLHAPLALTGGLRRVLGAIIEIPMLAMFHPWENLALGGPITFEFVGNDDPRYVG
jgi:hypothetical protein